MPNRQNVKSSGTATADRHERDKSLHAGCRGPIRRPLEILTRWRLVTASPVLGLHACTIPLPQGTQPNIYYRTLLMADRGVLAWASGSMTVEVVPNLPLRPHLTFAGSQRRPSVALPTYDESNATSRE